MSPTVEPVSSEPAAIAAGSGASAVSINLVERTLRVGDRALREGDVITQVANTEVSDTKAFAQVVGKLDKSKSVSVLLRRGEWSQYTVIRPL